MDDSLTRLNQFIVAHYDLEELRDLCFRLGVDYDSLRGEGKAAKTHELVLWLDRRGRTDGLLDALREPPPELFEQVCLRPDVSPWAGRRLAVNKGLFVLAVGAVLFFFLLRFTSLAEPILGILSILGGLVVAFFPGIRELDKQPWFIARWTTVILILFIGAFAAMDGWLLLEHELETDLRISCMEGTDAQGNCGVRCSAVVAGQGVDKLELGDLLAVYGPQARLSGGRWSETPIGVISVVLVQPDTAIAQGSLVHEESASDASKRLAAGMRVAPVTALEDPYLIPAFGDGYVLGAGMVYLRPGVTAQAGAWLAVLEPRVKENRILDHTQGDTILEITALGQEGLVAETHIISGSQPTTGTLVALLAPGDVDVTLSPKVTAAVPEMVPILYGAAPFEIGKTEITNAQFRPFVENDGYANPVWWDPTGWEWRHSHDVIAPRCWTEPDLTGEDQPVVCVTWHEAAAYANWLSAQTSQDYRLPDEDQWLWAACGARGYGYPWGESWEPGRANFADLAFSKAHPESTIADRSNDDGFASTAPVGSFPAGASPDGVLDLAGNVWEWTSSVEQGKYVYRGGGWGSEPGQLDCAFWQTAAPEFSSFNLGFRLVRLPR